MFRKVSKYFKTIRFVFDEVSEWKKLKEVYEFFVKIVAESGNEKKER